LGLKTKYHKITHAHTEREREDTVTDLSIVIVSYILYTGNEVTNEPELKNNTYTIYNICNIIYVKIGGEI